MSLDSIYQRTIYYIYLSQGDWIVSPTFIANTGCCYIVGVSWCRRRCPGSAAPGHCLNFVTVILLNKPTSMANGDNWRIGDLNSLSQKI